MEPKLNYVLAAWSGNRRTPDPAYAADPAFFLREHFRSLQELRHNLSRVTVCVPHNPGEPAAFAAFRREAPKTLGAAEVVWLDRPNVGMSYGSWNDTFLATRGEFTHYVLMEDDYQFCLDDFDRILLGLLRPKVGLLCGMVRDEAGPHPAIALGIAPAECLADIVRLDGRLPHARDDLYGSAERHGQIAWGNALRRTGWGLEDWMSTHRTVFRYGLDRSCHFGESEGPVLAEAIGMYNEFPIPQPGDPGGWGPPTAEIEIPWDRRSYRPPPGVGGRRGYRV